MGKLIRTLGICSSVSKTGPLTSFLFRCRLAGQALGSTSPPHPDLGDLTLGAALASGLVHILGTVKQSG